MDFRDPTFHVKRAVVRQLDRFFSQSLSRQAWIGNSFCNSVMTEMVVTFLHRYEVQMELKTSNLFVTSLWSKAQLQLGPCEIKVKKTQGLTEKFLASACSWGLESWGWKCYFCCHDLEAQKKLFLLAPSFHKQWVPRCPVPCEPRQRLFVSGIFARWNTIWPKRAMLILLIYFVRTIMSTIVRTWKMNHMYWFNPEQSQVGCIRGKVLTKTSLDA